jgi:hypothetical protein
VRSSTANDGVSNVLYSGNTFLNCWNGISNDASTLGTFTIDGNSFTGLNNAPVVIRDSATTTINNNTFVHDGIFPPLNNLRASGAELDARFNYWGTALPVFAEVVSGLAETRPMVCGCRLDHFGDIGQHHRR